MDKPEVSAIDWTRGAQIAGRSYAAGLCGPSLLIIFAIAIFAAIVLGPVLEALIAYGFYRHWALALAEQTDVKPGIIAAIVPAIVTSILVLKRQRRTITRPWSWLRPYVILFCFSLTTVESAKLLIGNRAVFGPTGEARQAYAIRSDGTVIIKEQDGTEVDAVSGRRFQPITTENRDWVEAMRRGGKQLPKRVDPAKVAWWLPGGQTILFYADHDGRLEFFGRPGRHPETNIELTPVTGSVRQQWEAAQRQESAVKELGEELQTTKLRLKKFEEDSQEFQSKMTAPQAAESSKETVAVVQQSYKVEANDRSLPEPSTPRPPPVNAIPAVRERVVDMASVGGPNANAPSNTSPPIRSTMPTVPRYEPVPPSNTSPPIRSTMPMVPRYEPVPPPIPMHFECGTRHWRGTWCPRYGFPRSPVRIVRPPLRYHYPMPPRSCRPRTYLRRCR